MRTVHPEALNWLEARPSLRLVIYLPDAGRIFLTVRRVPCTVAARELNT